MIFTRSNNYLFLKLIFIQLNANRVCDMFYTKQKKYYFKEEKT
jgi:hypothetical protein